jgi:uncharacterized protein
MSLAILLFSAVVSQAALNVQIMSSPDELQRGLQGHPPLQSGEGMLFVFPYHQQTNFWMKGVTFPIDIVFVRGDGTVANIAASVPPCRRPPCSLYPSAGPVKYVVEAQAGWAKRQAVTTDSRLDIDVDGARVSVVPSTPE